MIKEYDIIRKDNVPVLKVIKKIETKEEYDNRDNQYFEETKLCMLSEYLGIGDYVDEHCYGIALDGYNNILGIILLDVGNGECVSQNVRRLGMFLLLIGAEGFMVVHNHPSQKCIPSLGDKVSIAPLKELANIIDIPLVGDYVITKDAYANIETDVTVLFSELEEDE